MIKTFPQQKKTKNLELAKAVLQAETNKQLKDYRIPETARKPEVSEAFWMESKKALGSERMAFLDFYVFSGDNVEHVIFQLLLIG